MQAKAPFRTMRTVGTGARRPLRFPDGICLAKSVVNKLPYKNTQVLHHSDLTTRDCSSARQQASDGASGPGSHIAPGRSPFQLTVPPPSVIQTKCTKDRASGQLIEPDSNKGTSASVEARNRSRQTESRKFGKWCPGAESNHRHEDFQSTALPLSYPGTGEARASRLRVAAFYAGARGLSRPIFSFLPAFANTARQGAAQPLAPSGGATKLFDLRQ